MIASGWRGELLRMALSKGCWETEEKDCPEQTVEREPLGVSEDRSTTSNPTGGRAQLVHRAQGTRHWGEFPRGQGTFNNRPGGAGPPRPLRQGAKGTMVGQGWLTWVADRSQSHTLNFKQCPQLKGNRKLHGAGKQQENKQR